MHECEVLILGAGMSGLCTGVQLKRAGIDDFVILEKSPGLGGTWWDNRYPGAQVDVPAPLYSFSFAPNPRWKRRFAAAEEIQAYMKDCAQRHGLLPHLRLGIQVSAARFDEGSGRWLIDSLDGQRWSARFFVCSLGPLSVPRWPEIDGLDRFAGERLHSARWNDGIGLHGRRVAVIGTGSTAAQLIPPLAAQAGRLMVFQRTANWVLPRIDRPYGPWDRRLARLPPYSAAVRRFWYAVLEWGRRGFDEGTLARRGMLRTAERLLQHQVADEALRARLRPPYPLGCKRLIYSNDYYRALVQPNVELVTEGIRAATPGGVQTVDGQERPVDVLVCATGFDVQHSLKLPVHGRGGEALSDTWAQGPLAHLGLTVAGFPNLFLMLGPNTATGHTSTLLFIEPGVRWAVRAMQEVRRRGRRWIDVRPAVMQAFNERLQERLRPSVWAGCRSWYRAEDGRIIALWPGFTREYVQAVQGQRFEDFEFG
jgi:cation diffusion facilitator CzcD-associated flavoprotein CzcO